MGEQQANKILFSLQFCTYIVRKHDIRKGFGDFWERKGGLTWCAMGEIPGFDRETWMGVAVPSSNKNLQVDGAVESHFSKRENWAARPWDRNGGSWC